MPSDLPEFSKLTAKIDQPQSEVRASREVEEHYGPTEMVILQGTTQCNINCSYCYLSERSRRSRRVMAIPNLRSIFKNLLSTGVFDRQLVICWHSGEPLVLPTSYYEEAIEVISELRDRYTPELQLRLTCRLMRFRSTTSGAISFCVIRKILRLV